MYFNEPLSGGLVTARDAAFLGPGELTKAQNCFYFPNDDALYRAPGYSDFGLYSSGSPSSSRAITSLNLIRFEGGQQYLIGQGAANLVYMDPETSGVMTEATANYSTATHLNAVNYKDRWYLFNGVNQNVVVKPGPIFRRHGLEPVSSPPAMSIVSSAFSLSTSGTYEYWYTEVAKYGEGDEVESAYTATDPAVIKVEAALSTHAPKWTVPARPINEEATHYRIYRSASLRVATDAPVFPVGYRVGEIPITDTSWVDGGTPATSSGWATSYDNDTINAFLHGRTNSGEFTSESAITAATDAAFTTYTRGATSGVTSNVYGRRMTVYNFGLLPTGNVTGIQVAVVAKANNPSKVTLYAAPGKRISANTTERFPAAAGYTYYDPDNGRRAFTGLAATTAVLTLGATTDQWLPSVYSWTSDVVASSAFAISLWAEFASDAPSTANIEIDSVKVTITHAGSAGVEYGATYDYITLELDGEQINFSANLLPPKASMGAVFQNSIVMNDVDNPRRLVWTNPGSGDGCPTDAYYLDSFGGSEGDEITYIGVISGRLIVGMRGSLWRVNYLPNENDASINRADAISPISTSVGIIHSRAATQFVTDTGTEGLALISPNGIFATDGLSLTPIGEDLQWNGTVGVLPINPTISSLKALVNDPGTQTLRLLRDNGNEYVMSYARRHRKSGGGKWVGPNTKRNGSRAPNSAVSAQLASGVFVPFYAYSGTGSSGQASITREDSVDTGYITAIPSTTSASAEARTRDIYPAGLDGEIQVHDCMWYGEYLSGASPSPDATLTLTRKYLRAAESAETMESSTSASGGKLLFASATEGRCAGFSIGLVPASAEFFRLYSVHPRLEGFGSSDNA